jgi:hypothetical protein
MKNEATSNSPCPFGPSLQMYWNRLSPEQQMMKLTTEALYSLAM